MPRPLLDILRYHWGFMMQNLPWVYWSWPTEHWPLQSACSPAARPDSGYTAPGSGSVRVAAPAAGHGARSLASVGGAYENMIHIFEGNNNSFSRLILRKCIKWRNSRFRLRYDVCGLRSDPNSCKSCSEKKDEQVVIWRQPHLDYLFCRCFTITRASKKQILG